MISPNEPFICPVARRWIPREMVTAPELHVSGATGFVKPRFALLINPFYPKEANASFGKHVLTPTLALTSFAAKTPADWHVEYWDENLLHGRPPYDPMPQVVGITVHLTFARRAYELADWYRGRGSKVILGGLHVVPCPEECAPHADALALGDGVQLWPRILPDIEANELRLRYVATYENDYRDDPPPRPTIPPHRSFLTTTSLIATRDATTDAAFVTWRPMGCACPTACVAHNRLSRNSFADHQPYAVFIDNSLGSRRDYLHALCSALWPLNKIWSAAVTIDVTDDPSLIRNMALAGCTGVFIGFESLSDQNLADSHKKTPKTADYARRVRMLHDYGIQVNGSFVLGFDHDRKDVFARTAEWIEENRLECVTFHILTPYPATPLFLQLEAEGRILHRDWTLYDSGRAVFRPKHMTAEELEHGYAWIYQRLFSHAAIWKWRPEQWQAVPLYLAMSYLYKRSNRFWRWLIKHDLVKSVGRPLVQMTGWRHVRYRRRIAEQEIAMGAPVQVLTAGVWSTFLDSGRDLFDAH